MPSESRDSGGRGGGGGGAEPFCVGESSFAGGFAFANNSPRLTAAATKRMSANHQEDVSDIRDEWAERKVDN
jgi:hypothetical protein